MNQRGVFFFYICFATPDLQNHMNHRRNGTKILIFPISIKIVNETRHLGKKTGFLALGFAKAPSQSTMFCQHLGTERDFASG